MLTAERVREVLNYDPETGVFTWKVKTCRKVVAGNVAGSVSTISDGYARTYIGIDGKRNWAHRLAWLHVTGEWPPEGMTIDHINGDATDNRWSNLRLATRHQNQGNRRRNKNNRSGVKGVHWHSQNRKWQARIVVGGRNRHIGLFDCRHEAGRAYMAAAEKLFGEFACDGTRE